MSKADRVERNPNRVHALMRALARLISSSVTIKTLSDDVAAHEGRVSLSDKTISQYLTVLNRMFVTDNLPVWNPPLRSKSAVRRAPKRQFVDPSIASAVLRLSADKLLADFAYFGLLFESLCARDLKIYSEANDGKLYHYRDSSGLEADAVIVLNDGRWAPVEVKLGSKEIEDAAANLLNLRDKIDAERMQEPSFLMIVTGGEIAYRRNDGVFIFPIGCLKN